MFVFLSKLLAPFLYPLGMALVLLALSLFKWKNIRWRNLLAGLALFILLVSSNRWVATTLARSLEWQYLPNEPISSAPAMVVLGGGTEPAFPPRSQPEVNSAGDRVLYAATLYRQGKAPLVIVSGGNVAFRGEQPSTPASDMRHLLEMLGVPPEAILEEDQSQNTYENALYCAKLLKERHIQQVILVTSALHMPRSVKLFEKQGIEVIPAPADFAVPFQEWEDLLHAPIPAQLVALLPSSSNLQLTTNVLHEYIGILVYWMRGWL